MPTIKDIARLAGVSHGTVSNVLNHRANVSMAKIRLVEDAARQLGYTIDERGKQLHQKAIPSIAVVLPNIRHEKYCVFYTAVSQYLQTRKIPCSLYLTNDIPALEDSALSDIVGRRCQGVIIVSCQPESSEKMKILRNAGTTVVSVERKIQNIPLYVGFDIPALCASVFRHIQGNDKKNIAVITELLSNSCESDFLHTLEEYCACRSLSLRTFQTDSLMSLSTAFSAVSENPAPDFIITSNLSIARNILNVCHFQKKKEPSQIVSLACSSFIESDLPVQKIEMDWKTAAHSACQLVFNEIQENTVLLKPTAPRPVFHSCPYVAKGTEINVLMLDAPDTRALQKLLPDFTNSTGISVRFAVLPYQELHDAISTMGNTALFDVVRMDTVWLGEFCKYLLQPYDPHAPEISSILSPMLADFHNSVTDDSGVIWAFPFTPNVQLHFYRRDLFEDQKVRRMYYEETRQNLAVPQTYAEYCKLLHFFSRSENPSSPVARGASIVSNTASGIACEFIPVFSSLGGVLFDTNGAPCVDSPAGLEALKMYLEMQQNSLVVPASDWWKGSVSHFTHGQTAMLNMFSNHVYGLSDLRKSQIAGRIGFCSVPGGKPLLGGGILGIPKNCSKKTAALEFIRWACGDHISVPFTLLGGISPCSSIYRNEDLLELYPWLSIVPENYKNGIYRKVPAGIDENETEKILGQAIKNVLFGIATPEESLKYVQNHLEQLMKQI